MLDIRNAVLPVDLPQVRALWLEYLRWGNDELEARFGFRMPVEPVVDHDLVTIAKFQPPDGRLLLAFDGDAAFGIAALRRIGADTAEIKRMYVRPAGRRGGVGRAMLERLVEDAATARYRAVRLDSAEFMLPAHRLYRSSGFVDIPPYSESEIPTELQQHWVFMERRIERQPA
ncbi:MAG: GNAT family N-acetyltransferase [Chloroflexi bacterium]|nr:GNAT family N-acetyltransferase [Chloroflexota bacterium]